MYNNASLLYWLGVCLAAAVLSWVIVFATRRGRPGLLLLSLTLFVYFVYGAANVELYREQLAHFFSIDDDCLLLAIVYAVLSIVAIVIGYSLPQRLRRQPKYVRASGAHFAGLSVVGAFALVIRVYAQGGIGLVWSRQPEVLVQWSGILALATNCVLLYPLYTYWNIRSVNAFKVGLAALFSVWYGVFALVSGVTYIHLVNAVPFVLIWMSRRRLRFRDVAAILVVGLLTFSVLRFSRFVGQMTNAEGGRWQEAVALYTAGTSGLDVTGAFPDFLVFSKAIAFSSDVGFQFGRTYLVPLAGVVPGILWAGKADFIAEQRVDSLIARYVGYSGQLLPLGFYGEGYVNFGGFGVAAASLVLGWLARRVELLIRTPGATFGVPRWCLGCLLLGALVGGTRGGMHAIWDLYVLQVGVIVAIVVLLSGLLPLVYVSEAVPESRQVRGGRSPLRTRRDRSWV